MSSGSNLSFPLVKFSHATDAASARSFSWRKETNGVRLLFSDYGTSNYYGPKCSTLIVLQGDNVLERVDLLSKIRESDRFIENEQFAQRQVKPDDIPTLALHKRPNAIIALRYPMDNKQVRRIQLKLENTRDFDTVIDVLRTLGCHLRDHEAPQTPATAPMNPIAGSLRPSSALLEPFPSCNRLNDRLDPSLEVPSSRHSFVDRHNLGQAADNAFRPSTTDRNAFRPVSSSQVVPSSSHSYDRLRPNTPLFPIREDESIHSDAVLQNIGGIDPAAQRFDPLRRRLSASASGLSSTNLGPTSMPGLSSSVAAESRLSSATSFTREPVNVSASSITLAQLEDNLSSMIPPRRELPFKRPSSKQSGLSQEGGSSRPVSSAEILKPVFAKQATSGQQIVTHEQLKASSVTHTTPMNAPPAAPPGDLVTIEQPKIVKRPDKADAGSEAATNKKVRLSTTEGKIANKPAKKPRSLKTMASKPANRPTSAAGVKKVAGGPSPSSGSANIDEFGKNILNDLSTDIENAFSNVNTTMAGIVPTTALPMPASDRVTLTNYAAKPSDERMDVLQQMIIEGIQDDNFVTLCEDVSACWQRIGLAR